MPWLRHQIEPRSAARCPASSDQLSAAKRLIELDRCVIVIALGMPGKEAVDKVCAHEASTGDHDRPAHDPTPILEVFVHEDEAEDPAVLAEVFKNRSTA